LREGELREKGRGGVAGKDRQKRRRHQRAKVKKERIKINNHPGA